MCLTSLHNIQQDLINFIPGFSSLLMEMIFFLLLKQTVPNSDTRYFRASVIYIYTNPMVMYELMRIRHIYIYIVRLKINLGYKTKLFKKLNLYKSINRGLRDKYTRVYSKQTVKASSSKSN